MKGSRLPRKKHTTSPLSVCSGAIPTHPLVVIMKALPRPYRSVLNSKSLMVRPTPSVESALRSHASYASLQCVDEFPCAPRYLPKHNVLQNASKRASRSGYAFALSAARVFLDSHFFFHDVLPSSSSAARCTESTVSTDMPLRARMRRSLEKRATSLSAFPSICHPSSLSST